MDTLFILLNDTITSCDTLVMKCAKTIECCQPIIQEASTNCKDVGIVGIICGAIAIISVYGIYSYFGNMRKRYVFQQQMESQRETKEAKDRGTRQKAEILDKYLSFLKERNSDGDPHKSEQYKAVLEYLVVLTQKGHLDSISLETLNNIFNNNSEKGDNT